MRCWAKNGLGKNISRRGTHDCRGEKKRGCLQLEEGKEEGHPTSAPTREKGGKKNGKEKKNCRTRRAGTKNGCACGGQHWEKKDVSRLLNSEGG